MRDRPRTRAVQLTPARPLRRRESAGGPSGALPLTPELLRERPVRRRLRAVPERGDGLGPAKTARDPFLILSTQGGLRADDGTPVALGLPHGPLGGRAARPRGGGGARPPRRPALRRARLGPVRRADPGDDGDVRLARVPERRGARPPPARPEPADPARRDRCRHMRQGTPGDDDGAGVVRRPRGRRDPRWGDAAPAPGGGRGGGPDARRTVRAPPRLARGGRRPRLPRLRHARRRLPVPRHRGDRPGRRARRSGSRSRTRRSRPQGSRSGSTLPAAPRAPSTVSGATGARSRTCSPRKHSRTRCSPTPPSEARRTC